MSGVSRRKGLLGVAVQPALGSPASAPTYLMPIISGGLKANRTREDLPFTRDSASRPGQAIRDASGGGSVTVPVFPDPVGLFFYALMGAQAYAAPISPNTGGRHKFSMTDDFGCYVTFWQKVASSWWKFNDALITRGQLTGQAGRAAQLAINVISPDAHPLSSDPSLPTLAANDPRFKFIGSTVELGADTATPTATSRVEQVDLIIDRRPDVKYGPSLTPTLLTPERELEFQAQVTYDPNDLGWAFVLGSAFGSASGTALSQDIGTGSFYVDFGRHPAQGGSDPRFLRAYSGPPLAYPVSPPYGQNWEYMAERPDADPAGGPFTYQVTGQLVDPGSGNSEASISLANEVLGLYAP